MPVAALATVAIAAGSANGQSIVAVPWLGDPNLQHEVYSGASLILQSVAELPVGCTITAATWDPGDGSGPIAVSFANPRAIELSHVYTGIDFQPYTATVSITTTCGSASDTFRVIVVPRTLDVDVNMAIDRGLWRLHKNMFLSSVGGVPTGYWATQNQAADTASAVLAFQINGHLEVGNRNEDPYVDDVARGLAHTFTELSRINITPQAAGNPDTNGNGYGLEVTDGGAPIYVGGQLIDAIVGSGTPNAVAPTGIAEVVGRKYVDIVQDMLDTYSWGQADTGSFYRGGWRYGWNAQDADNSACQWWAIGGIAAERVFGLAVPQWVKDENLNFWIPQSQYFDGTNAGADGRFGYTDDTNYVDIVGMNTTPSGLVQMNFDGALKTDPRHVAAQRYMIRNWTQLTLNNRIYGMFATAKAMRLALPTPVVLMDENGAKFDWYRSDTTAGDSVDGIARRLVNLQQADGSWDGAWVFNDLASAWSIITLSATIVQLAPHAVADVDPTITGPNQPVEFDGSPSFHSDPARNIVSYEWDFDGDGTFDATGQFVTHSYPALGVYNAKLRVTDDNVPPLTDETVTSVNVTIPPYPPDSNPGRHYQFCIGVNEPFILDGTKSKDIDGTIVSWEWDFDPQPLDNDFDDATTPTVDVTAFFTALGPGIYDVGLTVTDDVTLWNTDFATVEVFGRGDCPVVKHDPVCPDGVTVTLWPPERQYVDLDLAKIAGVTDPAGEAITFAITSITQDEPVTFEDDPRDCDGYGIGGGIATLKAERAPYKKADGRIYVVHYTATNTSGGSCSNFITVHVPKKAGGTAVDTGQKYDSTQGCDD